MSFVPRRSPRLAAKATTKKPSTEEVFKMLNDYMNACGVVKSMSVRASILTGMVRYLIRNTEFLKKNEPFYKSVLFVSNAYKATPFEDSVAYDEFQKAVSDLSVLMNTK